MKRIITSVLLLITALCCISAFAQHANPIRELSILYTNDEHGWLEGMSAGQGAANLYQLWEDTEGFVEDGPFLVLSGGDNFTGPAISTWVEGQSMVEIMNAMHYDAAAVGNHEFDFGQQVLQQRTREASYPYLGANIRWHENGKDIRDLGILPYTIKHVNDLSIGIIGLTTSSTPYVSNPEHVKGLLFTDYEQALRATVSDIIKADTRPDLFIVIAHICIPELESLLKKVTDLNIALAGGGHCNELVAKKSGNTVILGGGFHFTSYAKATLTVDMDQNRIVGSAYTTRRNQGATANPALKKLVSKWAKSASDSLEEIIAYNATQVKRGAGLDQLILRTWLDAYPAADIAISNRGGVRADLGTGEISLSDIVNILPFNNTIISVEVTGRDITRAMKQGGRLVVAGMEADHQRWILGKSGRPLNMDQTYRVLLNSFLYAGGNNFSAIADADPNGIDSGVNYRQPFYLWLKEQGSSPARPLRF